MIDHTTYQFLDWANRNIPADKPALLLKFKEEAEEFIEHPTPFEAADVIFCVVRYAFAARWNLRDAMARKFEVLKRRRYELMPNGTWHHIKETV